MSIINTSIQKITNKSDKSDPCLNADPKIFNPKCIKMCAAASKSQGKLNPILSKQTNNEAKHRLRAAVLKAKIWPNGTTIKIAFLEDPPADLERTSTDVMEKSVDANGVSLPIDPMQYELDKYDIKSGIIKIVTERIQPIVNVKFQFHDTNQQLLNPNVADIRISFDPNGGAWSLIGLEALTEKDKTKATMNLGWFDMATTTHEWLHAIGFVHEHQNPNGNEINWDIPRVLQWAKTEQGWDAQTTKTNIIDRYKHDEINGSTYDPTSIMLYFFPATLTDDPKTGTCCGSSTQQNFRLSPYDVLFLNKTYPLSNITPEEFTVKFFNDVFNTQIDIKDLQKQLASPNATGASVSSSQTTSSTTAPTITPTSAPISAHALKQNLSNTTTSSDDGSICQKNDGNYSSFLMPIILTILTILMIFVFLAILFLIIQLITKRNS